MGCCCEEHMKLMKKHCEPEAAQYVELIRKAEQNPLVKERAEQVRETVGMAYYTALQLEAEDLTKEHVDAATDGLSNKVTMLEELSNSGARASSKRKAEAVAGKRAAASKQLKSSTPSTMLKESQSEAQDEDVVHAPGPSKPQRPQRAAVARGPQVSAAVLQIEGSASAAAATAMQLATVHENPLADAKDGELPGGPVGSQMSEG